MKKKILVIEDEKGIADNVIYTLETEGFIPTWVITGGQALESIQNENYSLALLDIGLPDINGFELLKQIKILKNIPVIFLTARDEDIDKVVGLEIGADDYITKPFSPRVLTARIKAVLRRVNPEDFANEENAKIFLVDINKKQISYFGVPLELSQYEYKILKLLLSKPGWVYSRDKIMEIIWNNPEEILDRTVDAYIKSIRAKLKKIQPEIDPIKTKRGFGYSIKENI